MTGAFRRTGKSGSLTIDDVNEVRGESRGNLKMLDVRGNLFLGER